MDSLEAIEREWRERGCPEHGKPDGEWLMPERVEVREVITMSTDYDAREGSSTVRLLLMSDGTVHWRYGDER